MPVPSFCGTTLPFIRTRQCVYGKLLLGGEPVRRLSETKISSKSLSIGDLSLQLPSVAQIKHSGFVGRIGSDFTFTLSTSISKSFSVISSIVSHESKRAFRKGLGYWDKPRHERVNSRSAISPVPVEVEAPVAPWPEVM